MGQTNKDMSCEFEVINIDTCGREMTMGPMDLTHSNLPMLYMCLDRGINWIGVGWT